MFFYLSETYYTDKNVPRSESVMKIKSSSGTDMNVSDTMPRSVGLCAIGSK